MDLENQKENIEGIKPSKSLSINKEGMNSKLKEKVLESDESGNITISSY